MRYSLMEFDGDARTFSGRHRGFRVTVGDRVLKFRSGTKKFRLDGFEYVDGFKRLVLKFLDGDVTFDIAMDDLETVFTKKESKRVRNSAALFMNTINAERRRNREASPQDEPVGGQASNGPFGSHPLIGVFA